ncbi:NADPH2:quinone reductase [Oceanospirillum multiglobuliferum]|uniref:Zinc-type alcohol dehydrogenase-like protein n=1 Tax=Oceanospirillum multiglobuliferum TaxID=64969 RepID=A0A1T4RCW8_9GAMM|nr:zinc-binding alcohol dehydrogenase family protein [Oceanospirillum multiglobuliferum]OPX55178.1 NADPH:quinone reductase [Oceanospirillum multiglobuliferum]SKA13491.1 NADPH2:quinone reductase [Oceanospirillum multiglobuliferum]
MKAIGFIATHEGTAAENLEDITLERPTATGHDLLVKVKAISVNPVDTKIRSRLSGSKGEYKVLGWDAVGEVVEIGDRVNAYQVGDKVWYAGDITRSGSNAEYHLVDERIVGLSPKTISDAEAAALPLTAITAWELLFDRLALKQDVTGVASTPKVLIVGAAGGVGSILIQLTKQLTGATVIATASRPESQAWVKTLGADIVINHKQPLTLELSRVGISEVTHVISLNRTEDYFDQLIEVLAPQGKLALIDDPETILDIRKLKQKSLSLHWELMFTRSMFKTEDMIQQRELLNRVAELVDAGKIRTTIGTHYGAICAENLIKAHQDIENGKAIGKIVLESFA